MLTKEQAAALIAKYQLHDHGMHPIVYEEKLILALIEASRGDFHLKLEAARKPTKQERQGFNDWKNPT